MKVLELFSGTGSIGKVAKKLDWDVLSLDLELEADIKIDLMDWKYKEYDKDSFDIIWASPPCTFYSCLQNCWIGRKKKDGILITKDLIEEKRKESDKLIQRTLDIIKYFNPHWWFMENPATGQLKDRDVVKGLPFYDVSYCMYSQWGYEKKTRIWTNRKDWNNLICDKSGSCGNMIIIQNRHLHKNNLGRSSQNQLVRKHKLKVSDVHSKETKKHQKDVSKDFGGGTNRLDRYRIPPDLIYSLFTE